MMCATCHEDPAMVPAHNASTIVHVIRWLRSDEILDLNLAAYFLRETPGIEDLGLAREAERLWSRFDYDDGTRARVACMVADLIAHVEWEPCGDEYERTYLG